MGKMISTASGFQSSVNITYDLNNPDKLKSYIPTRSALDLLESILLSTRPDATDRARILIGAYGKGKSHITLMILSILMKKDLALFSKMIPIVKETSPKLFQLIQNYYAGKDRILPIVVSGANNSVSQAFVLALKHGLEENGLTDIMPKTNYEAAVMTLKKWKEQFPDTYQAFVKKSGEKLDTFTARLLRYDPSAYEKFESLYPDLTAGSTFDPYSGFDVVRLYEEVEKSLEAKGYTGLYVVFDEFNKYLENHIRDASRNDTKILQDFAEKCSRSGKHQLHLLLISHKEITSYIDTASKETVDGWRGVSERFHHIYLNNNFSQIYEIIAAAIEKEASAWNSFQLSHKREFEELSAMYRDDSAFNDLSNEEFPKVIYGCYPLHPISTYILPRISERVAQNERTLFTFISSTGKNTLSSYLDSHDESKFCLVTPDLIYDYFEPLLRQEIYSGNLSSVYQLTAEILKKITPGSLEAKIVKTLSLIYILQHFEKVRPTVNELNGIFYTYGSQKVSEAVKNLVEKEYVIYQEKSNGYLRLKGSSGVDLKAAIENMIGKQAAHFDLKEILNGTLTDVYFYPYGYNTQKNMTRYFEFRFIRSSEVTENVDWERKRASIHADGVIFAVIPESSEDISCTEEKIINTTKNCNDIVFILPSKYEDIKDTAQEYAAVHVLRETADNDVLKDEYEIVEEDLSEVIRRYIAEYTRPEYRKASYFYQSNKKSISRRKDLSSLLSSICMDLYGLTPVINNELINIEKPTTVTCNARKKITAGLLRTDLEQNLGLTGNSQEASIMRSTLIRTGILEQKGSTVRINLSPADPFFAGMISTIRTFIESGRANSINCFELYYHLISPVNHIGIRRGVIPIYFATVLHEYRKEVVISSKTTQVPISAELLEQINASPEDFSLKFIDWSDDKESYLNSLNKIFQTANYNDEDVSYDSVEHAMRRWYMALPKYAKNITKNPDGSSLPKSCREFEKAMKENDGSYVLLFEKLPAVFGVKDVDASLADKIEQIKNFLDHAISVLKDYLADKMKEMFCTADTAVCKKMSLTSVAKDWCNKLDQSVFEQVFNDGTDRFLEKMRNITNDEPAFISDVAVLVTDLHIEDWDYSIISQFLKHVDEYRNIAENFHQIDSPKMANTSSSLASDGSKTDDIFQNSNEPGENVYEYELNYIDSTGKKVTKRFTSTKVSSRGKLLYNMVKNQLTSMGGAISEIEKRQVLMDILKEM